MAAGLGAALAASLIVSTASPADAAVSGGIRVWAGATSFTDHQNVVWAPATGFVGGSTVTVPASTPVDNLRTADDLPAAPNPSSDRRLYATTRVGVTGWSAAVTNGRYRVELRLLDPQYANAGQRVFNVQAEGNRALTAVDIAKNVTQNSATERIFEVAVTDGVLNLTFPASTGTAVVSSIAADRVPARASGVPTKATTGFKLDPANPPTVIAAQGATPYKLTIANHVYENLDINARVEVWANGITLKNSIVRGDNRQLPGSVIDMNRGATGFTLVDSTIQPTYEQWQADGILGHDFTVLRSEITGTTDAVKVVGDNVTVQDSWLHDTRNFNGFDGNPNDTDTTPDDDTHNDGVQAVKGNNITIVNNLITGNRNAAMQLGQDQGAITNVTFSGNWVDDGGCSVNVASKNSVDGSVQYGKITLTVTGNVFWRHQSALTGDCAVIRNATKSTVTDGGNNKYVDPIADVVFSNGL